MRHRRILVAIAALVALHGCPGPAAAPTAPTPSRKREATPSPAPTAAATGTPTPLATDAPPPTPAPTATPTALPTAAVSVPPVIGLSGVVSIPATLIDAKLVSNNGGNLTTGWGGALAADPGLGALQGYGIVSNNGGGYRLLQAASGPVLLDGALVRLLDAAGQPVKGPDGKALEARTDAQGRYRIDAALPPKNLIAAVVLPGRAGALLAIAPRDAGSTRRADLDLASTLATGYVLGQYVTTQADPVAVLERLPGAIEAQTRLEAGRAAAGVAPPLDLAPTSVARAVADLRRRDAAFDAQMEVVRKLLVAAGQADLGAGKPAREVALTGISQVLFGLDGATYLAAGTARRLWRLRPDGILETAAGSGAGNPVDVIDGVPAPQAGLGELGGVTVDRQGRLLILELPWKGSYARLSRLGPDGKLQELFRSQEKVHAAFEAPGGAIWIFQNAADLQSVKLLELVPGGAPKQIHAFTGEEAKAASLARNAARDDQGRLYFQTFFIFALGSAYRFDPGTKALTKLDTAFVDQFGTQFKPEGGRAAVTPADGRAPFTLGPWPAEVRFAGAAIAPGGQPWVFADDAVWRRDGEAWTQVAGRAGGASGDGELPLKSPESMYATADALYVVDNGTERKLYKVAGGKGALFAGGQGVPSGTEVKGKGDGGPAIDAGFMAITHVAGDAAGNLYVAERYFLSSGVRKIAPDGTISTFGTLKGQITDMAVAADGRAWLVTADRELWEVAPAGGAATKVAGLAFSPEAVTLAPDGTAWIKASNRLYKREGAAWTLMKTDDAIPKSTFQSIAADAQGRVYIGQTSPPKVSRYDPATGTIVPIAGADAPALNGSGVDDGLAYVADLAIAPDGALLIADKGHQQVKRLPIRE